jgi:hypothetical protein
LGVRIPVTSNEQNTVAHYSLMLDYYTCRYFIPFVSANFFTSLSNGTNFPGLRSNGYDVINFGGSRAGNTTQGALGVGFRSRILDNVDFGIAYEKAVVRPYGLMDDRITCDLCIRF